MKSILFCFIVSLFSTGLEPFERRMALAIKPVMKLNVEGEIITTKIKAGAIKNKTSFRLGEVYELSVLGNVYKVFRALLFYCNNFILFIYFLYFDRFVISYIVQVACALVDHCF